MRDFDGQIQTLLSDRRDNSRMRQLRSATASGTTEIILNGKKLINFASNDYLGLSQHPRLKERAIKAVEQYGVGCPSSRLIAGNCELYEIIESQLATLKGTETALIFPTGFQTNIGVMLALSKLNTILICDKLSHSSILLGAQFAKRQFARFNHNDIKDLQCLLDDQTNKEKSSWIVTESVFSMDGDLAPIREISALSQNHNSQLYIDEAHATGVFGTNGMGLVYSPQNTTVLMGTFGKGCGSFGAYIACSNQFKDFLVNYCPGLIYTTALPPAVLGAIQGALDMIPEMVPQRNRLLQQATSLRENLQQIGFDTGQSASQIICLHIGADKEALVLSKYLEQNNIYAPAIRPPTVPENRARVRISLSAAHKDAEIAHLCKILGQWHANKF